MEATSLKSFEGSNVYSARKYAKTAFPKEFPLIAVTGTNGKTTTTRLIGYILSKSGRKVGMTTTGGIFINGQCVCEGDTTGPKSAQSVLNNTEIDAAVLETARGGIVRDGLAYDLADVAVITNITDDHLGLDGIETLEQLAMVKSVVGEAVKKNGYVVINGDDKMSITILNRLKSKLIVFSKDKNNETLINNLKIGEYGIYIAGNYLCIQKGSISTKLIRVNDIGITMAGVLTYNIENAMAACAAAIGLGIDHKTIREALENFKCNEELNPGRFNTYEINGILAILDYGHNIDGYKAVLEGLTKLKHNRLIGVIGVPGDRLDRNITEVGSISGKYFDHIFIKEDKDRRGRLPGEVADILEHGVLNSGFSPLNIEKVLSEEEAFGKALDYAESGDIVIVFFEDYEPLAQMVKNRINTEKTAAGRMLVQV